MFTKDIGIDLGTANVLIYVKGQGIVLNEPSVVAIDNDTKKTLAVGIEAKEMLGRTPGDIVAIKPMKDGVIADFEITETMLNYFIKKINGNNPFITQVEKNAIRDAAEKTGAKKVYIEEEPKVAAIGAGLDISKANGCMVVDIGGGTTDIAILSLGGIVKSSSLKIAGNTFDYEISKYIKDKFKLLIGERTAENIKLTIGSVFSNKKNEEMEIKGRHMITGLPKTITITSNDVIDALSECVDLIIQNVKLILEQTPPELSSDIYENGIVLTGGGSLVDGLDKALEKEIQVPVYLANNPLTCVCEGTGIMLENLNLLDKLHQ